jgi:hypothetical protein
MKKLKLVSLLAALALSIAVQADDQDPKYYGVGNSPCREYLEAIAWDANNEDGATWELVYVGWAHGYISAMNQMIELRDPSAELLDIDFMELRAKLVNACAAGPEYKFGVVIGTLVGLHMDKKILQR